MSRAIRFSVLVPVYNVAEWLRTCVDSVLTQSFQNFELLLVNDGSADESRSICDEYAAGDSRIRVFHKPNGGPMSARRYAIERMTGEYCIFLDSDDRLERNALEVLDNAIRETGAECLIFSLRWERPDGVAFRRCPEALCGRLITDRRELLNFLLNDESFNTLGCKCVKASCFDGRDFSPWFHIRRGEDRIQSTEILENAASFLLLPDVLYVYCTNAASITHSVDYDNWRADFEVERFILDWLERLGVFVKQDYDRLHNHLLDELVNDLKRLCRFCTSPEKGPAALQRVRISDFYRSSLRDGYRGGGGGLRRFLNRIALFLFDRGCFGALIFYCARIYKAH